VSAVDPTWLTNCAIVDVRDGTKRHDASLEIAGGMIRRIVTGRREGPEAIDLRGRYVVPGIISCHTHLWVVLPFADADPAESPALTALRASRRAKDALHAGVTTVRTLSERYRADLFVRHAAAQGWIEAPRIVAAGQALSVTGGHGSIASSFVNGGDGFLAAARAELAAGADHIKIFITGGIMRQGESLDTPQMTDEEISGAVRAATDHHTYVAAHAASSGPIRRALELGVRGFEHAYRLDDETAKFMAAEGAYLTPTLCVSQPRSAEFMRAHGFQPWAVDLALETGIEHRASIGRAIRAGVTLVNGTDFPPGAQIDGTSAAVYEMELMVEAGLSPLQSLQAATVNAARLCNLDTVGRIDEGMAADIIAVPNDPTTDISAMRSIQFVMQMGRVITSELG
jgi:imidazolonepropionase-like amidohydrolase